MAWRVPPVDRAVLGKQAASGAPSYEQLLVDVGPGKLARADALGAPRR